MTVQTKTIGRMPTDHGPYDPSASYGKKYCVTLYGCMWESLHNNNNTAPAVWDGGDTITPNTVDWKLVSGSTDAWLANLDKPASTGTTGDYPYNGLGRIVLKKKYSENIDYANQPILEQADFDDDNNNHLTNTVFVIKYDFVLTEDITLGSGCVLEFEGGSISGDGNSADTITGYNTGIEAGLVKVFNTNVTLAGTWNIAEAYPEWFGAKGDGVTDDTTALQKTIDLAYRVVISKGTYRITFSSERYYGHNGQNVSYGLKIQNNDIVFEDATLVMDGWNSPYYYMLLLLNAQNTYLRGKGNIIGDRNSHLTPSDTIGEGHVVAIMLGKNISIDGLTIKDAWGDGIWIMNNGEVDCAQGKFPEYIQINGIVSDNCIRNGMAVCCGKHIHITNSQFNNANLYDPRVGIDIEANEDGYCIQDVHVSNVQSYGCIYGGVGAVMKTDGDSVYFDNIVTDSSVGVRMQGGCDNGKFSARNITCITRDDCLCDSMSLLNKGTNCTIDVSNISLKPRKGYAGVLVGNSDSDSSINISDINIDLSNKDNSLVPRHSPFIINSNNEAIYPTPGHLKNLTLKDCFVSGSDIIEPFVYASDYPCMIINNIVDIRFKDVDFTADDYDTGVFRQTSYTNNILIMHGLPSKTFSRSGNVEDMEEIRGYHNYYVYTGNLTRINLRYIPGGSDYYVTNGSANPVNIGFGGALVRYNNSDTYLVEIPVGSTICVRYDNNMDRIIASLI